MEGIPPARESDNEDVIWALETAESLWKRNAKVDAIVWVRRAAQEAAQAGDGVRATSLMVEAAALTEAIGKSSGHTRAAEPVTSPPPPPSDSGADLDSMLDDGDEPEAERAGVEIDDLLGAAVEALAASGEPGARGPETSRGDDLESYDPVMEAIDPEEATALDEGDLVTIPPPTPVPTGELVEAEQIAPLDALPFVGAAERDRLDPLAREVPGITDMGPGALSPMDLASVPALEHASEEDRDRLVGAARVILCVAGVELPECGLAVVLEGEVTATAFEAGPVIAHMGAGSIVHREGTLDVASNVRFEVSADDTTVALWSQDVVADGLVLDETTVQALRGEGDRLLAWSSVARSSLAIRLHEDVRVRLFLRFAPRMLLPGTELLASGQPVPGIFLVGDGTVTVDGPAGEDIESGGFVFPQAALSAARAPGTARAGDLGAIVLSADRRTTQELWATEPLLLELLAGS